VGFKEYVQNVLPNEWIKTWPQESLRAGAMAVKMYAWYYVSIGGKYEDADVYDSTCDQVYVPGVAYASTNRAIDFTWDWRLTDEDGLVPTFYRDWYWRCEDAGLSGQCMGQWDTYYHAKGNNGYDKILWDQMLFRYYLGSELSYISLLPVSGFMLRFYGNGWGDYDRVKILVDDPDSGGRPIDVGHASFTLEWWMKAHLEDNSTPACEPGGDNWMNGNILFDRDIPGDGDYGEYGVSLADGRISVGINNGTLSDTLCGSTSVADGIWHHVAVTRSIADGMITIFVDGQLDAQLLGPGGDISYRDHRTPQDPEQDPYLIVGARKADQGAAFSGWIDEVRISGSLRYAGPFQPPRAPFTPDAETMALYHFDEGYGDFIGDSSGAAGGPSHGTRSYGGDPKNGPEWEVSDLIPLQMYFFPFIHR
jgi:hypothetical protein